eukprot:CAMPEP_0178429732 /NCGR_PEP_ID=MMETSP0689_2-20121128/30955_1 /TAXON_ID=160604 /ORGANISM="Amphidinium massartii, Strain CS-259" /LENGTH=95 /DNA_ID=CAMNT_0020051565 /DNA_START=62 /DNA_END=347 /DNA_ORIENTATION=-
MAHFKVHTTCIGLARPLDETIGQVLRPGSAAPPNAPAAEPPNAPRASEVVEACGGEDSDLPLLLLLAPSPAFGFLSAAARLLSCHRLALLANELA